MAEEAAAPMVFALDRLLSYTDEDVIVEMRRVAIAISEPVLTRRAFDAVSRVSSDTCLRRFGGWQSALAAAGLEHRYGGRRVSSKMRDQRSKSLSGDEVAGELRRIADLLGKRTLTRSDVLAHSDKVGERVILNRFGSWKAALQAANLDLVPLGRRWTDDDYFENLLAVWTHYGRSPRYAEMGRPPSRISPGGYAKRFGSWGQAKNAFVERVNRELDPEEEDGEQRLLQAESTSPGSLSTSTSVEPCTTPEADRRQIRLGLRYEVLRRDRFRCVTCGRSPASDIGCVLHVDHVQPFSQDGRTTADNLRTLCEACNVGKGAGPA